MHYDPDYKFKKIERIVELNKNIKIDICLSKNHKEDGNF